ncbi:MAG TPA: NADH-quinone oxidoreductase subunit N, partial [Verrucomicrobiae bacterium]|nr:NADH-quinone oxidoreductase subunit N [Verrucomicrobiae bacterium]
MIAFDYKLLLLRLLPETIIIVGAILVLFFDQAWAKSATLGKRSALAVAGAIVTILLAVLALSQQAIVGSVYEGMLVLDEGSRLTKTCLLVLAGATLLISPLSKFTIHIGEYVALLLLGLVGLLLLAGTEELLTAFIALELTSLSLYLLTAFNKQSIRSAEAALKYFLFGSIAAAFTLFGISLIFGLAGSTSFRGIAISLQREEMNSLLVVGIVLTTIGLGFKMAAAPLHLWAPDAYQGAPIPSAALIASGSKLASFVLFYKFFSTALQHQAGSAAWGNAASGWMLGVAALASASMIVGNLLAIVQSNVRRLLAYSAIAHAGYILICLLTAGGAGAASGVYYLFTYGLSVVGAFGILGIIETQHGEASLSDLAGLSRRAPILALCLVIFILSLAGIPPLAGFFGKFYIFLGALDASRTANAPGLLWIVVLALATSAVSLYYYLQILKQAFVMENDSAPRLTIPFLNSAALCILAAGIIFFGCWPDFLVRPLQNAFGAPARSYQQV